MTRQTNQAVPTGAATDFKGGNVIQTFKQYDNAKRRALAGKYNVTLAELRRLYPPAYFQSDWWTETLKAYDEGAAFTTVQWNKLTDQQQWNVLRRPRALRMPSSEHFPWRVAAEPERTTA